MFVAMIETQSDESKGVVLSPSERAELWGHSDHADELFAVRDIISPRLHYVLERQIARRK